MAPPRPVPRSMVCPTLPGRSVGLVGRPRAALAKDDEQAAAALRRTASSVCADSPGGSIVLFRITTLRLASESPETRATCIVSTWNDGAVPIASALERKKLAVPRSLPSTTRTDTGWLGSRTKLNVLSAGIGSVPALTTPLMRRRRERERREGHRRGRVGGDRHGLRFHLAAVDLERDGDVRHRVEALVGDARRDGDALLAGERRAREGHRRHGDVRVVLAADWHRRDDDALAELDVLRAGPAGLLEVGNEDRLAAGERGPRRACFRPASAPGRSASRRT